MATLPSPLAASQVNDLRSLWEVFREAPRKVGEAWYIVELADLSVRDNSAEINRKYTWACVQIGALIINDKRYVLSPDSLDAHVTLDYWNIGTEPLLMKRANELLLEKQTGLEMEMKPDLDKCNTGGLCFKFMVGSKGRNTLEQLNKSLHSQAEKKGLHPFYEKQRAMSPPQANIFHFSVHPRLATVS